MENPSMTFVTPALVTGDRSEYVVTQFDPCLPDKAATDLPAHSRVSVIAHEASHSWFGNLVGVAEWGSFWLNEVCLPLSPRYFQCLH